jgi:hypothetical protein
MACSSFRFRQSHHTHQLGDPHNDSWETEMARRASLTVEGLEDQALLSSLACSLTTDQLVYQVGQLIELTFTETSRMIKAWHLLQWTSLWSGKPNSAGVKKLGPSIYTIAVNDDGYAASTTVDLVARHK